MNAGQTVEHKCKDQHGHEWLEHSPQPTQKSLSVTNLDIAPNKKAQQLAVQDDFLPINRLPSAAWLNDEFEAWSHQL